MMTNLCEVSVVLPSVEKELAEVFDLRERTWVDAGIDDDGC